MQRNEKEEANEAIEKIIGKNKPYPLFSPVDCDALMKDLIDTIKCYVVVSDDGALATALWVVQTWCYKEFSRCPLLLINAPERECGKTQLLKVVGMLVHRPLETANITLASLFRLTSNNEPTLLIDEIDTFMEGKGEMLGILNKGYESGGHVLRTESNGKELVTRVYKVYGPRALAGIKLEMHLPDATMSRGIQIPLKRKTKENNVQRLRSADPDVFKGLYSRINRFVQDHRENLSNGWSDMPEELSDRQQDNWESLLAIAHCFGAEWYDKACEAALAICAESMPPRSSGNQLLEDVREVLVGCEGLYISSAELLEMLIADEEMGWATYNRGQPLRQHQLTKLLGGYGIRSKTVRIKFKGTPKGFELRDFEDAFARYLPERVEEAPLPEDDAAPPSAEASKPPEPSPLYKRSIGLEGPAVDGGAALSLPHVADHLGPIFK